LHADSITVGKIAGSQISDNAIGSAHIANNTVIASKLLHSPAKGLDLVINSDFTDINGDPTLDGWTKSSGADVTIVDIGTNGITGKYAMQNSGANAQWLTTNKIPINRNKRYIVECYARTISGDSGTFFLVVRLLDINGNDISGDGTWWYYPASNVVPPSTWQYYYGFFGNGTAKQFPSNAAYMHIGVILNYQYSTNRIMQVQGLRIREVLDFKYTNATS